MQLLTSNESFTAKTTLLIEHTFTVSGPFFSHAARKLGPQKRLELLRQLEYVLDNDIEFSRSLYISPIHLVPEKEPNSFRFYVDNRKLNAVTLIKHLTPSSQQRIELLM